MKIYNYIKDDIFNINYEDNYTILDLASLFLKEDINSIIVLKDKKPLYIITSSDLINFCIHKDEDLNLKTIIAKYPKNLVFVHKDDDLYDAYKLMRNQGVEHLIVLDDNNELVGEVYYNDLITQFVEFALKDELTGLHNVRFLENIIQKYNGDDTLIGVIFIDIDDFKRFNDLYGHKVGDEVIQFVAQQIQDSIREIDFAFRYGGDEFIIMVFSQPRDIVLKIAKRIFDKITKLDFKEYGKIGISVGVALYPEDNKDLKEVIKLADKELYIAKNSGKGKIESSH